MEIFLYLWLSPGCGLPLLWHHYIPVFQPLILSLTWEGHGSCHDVHSGDPHAEPFHLQPEEQGHERGFKESAHHESPSTNKCKKITYIINFQKLFYLFYCVKLREFLLGKYVLFLLGE